MEPPSKRPRLSRSPDSRDFAGDDDVSLQIARARNNQKLKSLFEGIFEKYGKDFTDVGDEIDLRTGEIVVNKGHVLRMEHEGNTGEVSKTLSQRKPNPPSLSMAGEADSPTDSFDDELATNGIGFLGSVMPKEVGDDVDSSEIGDGTNGTGSPPGEAVSTDASVSAAEDDEIQFSTLKFPRRRSTSAKAVDPAWQVPEIDAKFWTPPRKQTSPKRISSIPDTRASSPPTAGSLWAIRTPGRPRGSSSKKQKGMKKSSPTLPSKRKRRKRAVLDWSFAQIRSDDSDSDDPLQEEAPSSTNRSIKIRGRNGISFTPTPSKPVPINTINTSPNEAHHIGAANQVIYDKNEEIRSIPGTPEVGSSSPETVDATPTQKPYNKQLRSPTKTGPTEFILTPDEVKLVVQMKCESMEYSWEDIIEHLPGRTLDDLQEWEESHPNLLDNNFFAEGGWSQEDFDILDHFADKPGIWWKDIQAALPNRSRRELENQMIRIWAEREARQKEDKEGEAQQDTSPERLTESPVARHRPSRTLYCDEDDPALRTGDVMTNKDLEDLLEEDFGDDWPEISAIEVEPRSVENTRGSQRGSPRKGSASPRKLF